MREKSGLYIMTLVSLMMVSTSCNQIGLGGITATKNFFKAPYDAVKNHISNSQYEEIAARSESQKISEVNSEMPSTEKLCSDHSKSSIPMKTGDYEALMKSTRKKVCSCRAWGTCTKDICNCGILCPNNFSIFKRPPFQKSITDLTKPENSLSFRNKGAMQLSSIKGTQGYCWGHASVTTKFNRLADFDPSNNSMKKMLHNPKGSIERDKSLKYFEGLIDDIIGNKTQTIPGYKNLKEFSSSDPDIESYIADKVARSWADRAMSLQGLSTTLGTSKMDRTDSQKFMSKVIRKINNNQQPQIVFTDEGKAGETHAVLVSNYIKSGNKTILCIRDNNLTPESNARCENKMYIDNDGSMYYSSPYYKGKNRWDSLGKVTVAMNDNTDALEQFNSLRAKCTKDKGCPNR